MDYTQDDLINIRELIAAGEGETQVNGRRVVYRDLDDLLKIERRIELSLARQAQKKANRPRRRASPLGSHFRTQTNRGLG